MLREQWCCSFFQGEAPREPLVGFLEKICKQVHNSLSLQLLGLSLFADQPVNKTHQRGKHL